MLNEKALLNAICANDLIQVKTLLADSGSLLPKSKKTSKFLLKASINQNTDMLTFLLNKIEPSEIDNFYAQEVFLYAVETNQCQIAKLLLDANAAFFWEQADQDPMLLACRKGHLEMVKLLHEKGDDFIRKRSFYTVLSAVSFGGSVPLFEFVRKSLADLNNSFLSLLEKTDSLLILSSACEQGHAELLEYGLKTYEIKKSHQIFDLIDSIGQSNNPAILKVLQDSGFDIYDTTPRISSYLAFHNIYPQKNNSIYQCLLKNICIFGNTALLAYLIEKKPGLNLDLPLDADGRTALIIASGMGHTDIVEILLQQKVLVNQTSITKFFTTALSAASYKGYIDVVDRLMSVEGFTFHGEIDYYGNAPIHYAIMSGVIGMLDRYICGDADLSFPDKQGVTPLMLAIKLGYFDMVERIISMGVNLNAQDNYGRTALMWAIKFKHLNVIEQLFSAGADLNIQKSNGQTPVILAIKLGNFDLINKFLDRGVDVNTQDVYGKNALMRAIQSDHFDVVKRLIIMGINLNAQDNRGRTALMQAILLHKVDAAIYLLNQPSIQTELKDHLTYTAEKYALQSRNPDIQALVFSKQSADVVTDSLSSSRSSSLSFFSTSPPISSHRARFFNASSPAPMEYSYKQTKALELACCIL